MSRFVSQCCQCSFSYGITCPQLKVPIQPEIVGCASAGCAGILPDLSLNQCGNEVWAFGDTLSAVNGIVTGADSSLDANCTHACCFTRTCPCIQYNLCNCCEVYANPGTYYHRIRYVTESFEVSEFSNPGCFRIVQPEYVTVACTWNKDQQNVCACVQNTSTSGVNQCVTFEVAQDSDFSCILYTQDCTGTCVTQKANLNFATGLNPNACGEYLSAGTTLYTRTKSYGGFTCQCVITSQRSTVGITGDLFVFALCDAVGFDPIVEGNCCIQLYATYTPSNGYCILSSIDTSYKFEVSPFCNFCSDVVTCCGCLNIFIRKCDLGGAGSCADYYVRACLINSCIAPPVVTCVRLGNVTTTTIPACSTCPYSSGALITYGVSNTINWTGPIVAMGIGSGRPGATQVTSPMCCTSQSNTVACTVGYCQFLTQVGWGTQSGQMVICKLENPNGCLNGCTFCLFASDAHWGSWVCFNCASSVESYFCIANSDICVISCAIGSMPGGGSFNQATCCLPFKIYQVAASLGSTGIVKLDSDQTSVVSTGVVYFNCCNVRGGCCQQFPHACYADRIPGKLISYCCGGGLEDLAPPGGCSYSRSSFCDPVTPFCVTSNNPIGLNLYGLGGPGAIWCVCNNICCVGGAQINCVPCRGFGFGAGGPAVPGITGQCITAAGVNDVGTGCRYFTCISGSQFIWHGCLAVAHSCNGRLMKFGGGGGGMLFLCNHYSAYCDEASWKGRPGLMLFACQGYS